MMRLVLAAGFALGIGANEVAAAEHRHPAKRHEGTGIWKSVVPPIGMEGQFGSHDPIGLAAGKLIKADCSLNWTDPDTGRLYCFSSATSLNYFLDWPKSNIRRADKTWRELQPTH